MSTQDDLYPCVGICMVDGQSGLCMGCGRPVHEPASAEPDSPSRQDTPAPGAPSAQTP